MGSQLLSSTGNFALTVVTPLAGGAHNLRAKLINGTTTEVQNYALTVDSRATGAISAVLVKHQGSGLTDNVSAAGSQTTGDLLEIRGTHEAWARVEVFDNGVSLGVAATNTSTSWTFKTTKPLDLGEHQLSVKITDLRGNETSTVPTPSL